MTFDYGATVKNLTLTFWPKIFFEVNIHVEKQGKNLGQKVNVKFFTHFLEFFEFFSWAVFWAEILI